MSEEIPLKIFENFFNEDKQIEIFNYLVAEINWSRDKYIIYDKEILSPRMTYYFGNKNYTYTNQTKIKEEFSPFIQKLANKIEYNLKLEKGFFNGCLLNYYRNGEDYISYHKDDEIEMDKTAIIAVLSFGASRKFYLKEDIVGEVSKSTLSGGSLAIMYPICQEKYKHSIPKEKKILNGRISLTFRRFK